MNEARAGHRWDYLIIALIRSQYGRLDQVLGDAHSGSVPPIGDTAESIFDRQLHRPHCAARG